MDLVTVGPIAGGQIVWTPAHGGFVLTLVCKATFSLRPGVSPISPSAEPMVATDTYQDGELTAASDLVPLKKMPEVIVRGHVYTPGGRRIPSCVARLHVGDIDKSLHVEGDRAFGPDGHLGEITAFVRMPISWRRAGGGPNSDNPVGRDTGPSARPDNVGRIQVPNFFQVDSASPSRGQVVSPVGFGPVAPHWPTRSRCLFHHANGWDPSGWNKRPLPSDIDLSYFNVAPADQQRAAPFAGDELILSNLHPLFAELRTRLAPAAPKASVNRGQGDETVQLRADTLLIDTDRGTATLVWRGHLMIPHAEVAGKATLSLADDKVLEHAPLRPPVFDHTQAAHLTESPGRALPFQDTSSADSGAPTASEANLALAPRPNADSPSTENAILSGATMPLDALVGTTLAFGFAPTATPIPFPAPATPTLPRDPVLPIGLPFGQGAPVPSIGAHQEPVVGAQSPVGTPSPALEPMLSGVEMSPWAHPIAPSESTALPGLLSPMPLAVEIPPEPTPIAEVPLTWEDRLAQFPVDRCGAITASLARTRSETSRILNENKLDPASWAEIETHWKQAISEGVERGDVSALAAFDAGYVAQLERERGPISAEDYGQMVVAAERGKLPQTLSKMGLPRGAMIRIERVILRRAQEDPALEEALNTAVVEARKG